MVPARMSRIFPVGYAILEAAAAVLATHPDESDASGKLSDSCDGLLEQTKIVLT